MLQAQADSLTPAACALCGIDLRLGFDFAVGAAMLLGLIWILYWIESASLAAIAENLIGVTVTGFVLFFFARFFFSTG